MGYANRIVLKNNGTVVKRGLIEPTLWGVCDTNGNEPRKTVNLTDFALVQGVQVTVRFTNTNTANSPTLNINNTGAIGIIYQSANIPANFLVAGINYQFVYNGTNFELISAATQWAVPQTVYVDLTTNSNQTTLQGGSSSAETLGVYGVLGPVNGGTGSSSHTANRIVWSNLDNSNNIFLAAAGNHYIDGSKIGVNYNSEPDANFMVQGTTIISSGLLNDGTSAEYFKVGNMTTRYLSIGANGLQAYAISNNSVSNGRLDLQPEGGTLYISSAQNTLTAHFYGTYNVYTAGGFNYKGLSVSSTDEFAPLWFSSEGINANTLELKANTGVPAYSNNLGYNANTHFIQINGSGGISSGSGNLNFISAADLNLGSGTNNGIVFSHGSTVSGSFNSNGTFIVGNPAAASVPAGAKIYIDGNSYLNGNLTVTGNIEPAAGTQIFGSTTNRWGGILVGSANSYGNAYEPIYWNNGVPAVVSTVQKQAFSIARESNYVELLNSAYDTNTIVLTIVITSGGENLNAPLRATPIEGKLTISTTSDVTDTVSGYVVTARGTELTQGG